MLKQALETANGIKRYGRGVSREELDRISEHNSAIYEKIISQAFGGAKSSCHISYASFWVYADTLSEVDGIKRKAAEYGYTNVKTILPHTTDSNGRKQPDPNGACAVVIDESNALLIGDIAKSLVKILKPVLDSVNDNLLHIYGHMGRFTFKFSDQDTSELFSGAVSKIFNAFQEEHGVMEYQISAAQEGLDCWSVSLNLKAS